MEDVMVLHSMQNGDSSGFELFGELLLLRRVLEEPVMKGANSLVAFCFSCWTKRLMKRWWLFELSL
jgi:hypothetical protein